MPVLFIWFSNGKFVFVLFIYFSNEKFIYILLQLFLSCDCSSYPLELHTNRKKCRLHMDFVFSHQNYIGYRQFLRVQKVPVTYGFCLSRQNYIGYRQFLRVQKVPVTYVILTGKDKIHRLPAISGGAKSAGNLCNSNGKRTNPQVTGTFCVLYLF